MGTIRRSSWFATVALTMAVWITTLWCIPAVAEATIIASHGAESGDLRASDIAKVQAFLERKELAQKMLDYGVSPQEAIVKLQSMSDQELHQLASLTDRVPAGTDGGVGLLIGLAVLVILIIVIIMLLNKRIVVR